MQQSLFGPNQHVGEVHRPYDAVELSPKCARADADVVAVAERARHQQHDAGEEVAERLLGSDAEHDPDDRTADRDVRERHGDEAQGREDDDGVPDDGDDDAKGSAGAGARPEVDDVFGPARELSRRGDTENDEDRGRYP